MPAGHVVCDLGVFVKISLKSTDLGLSPGGPLLGEEGLVGGFSQSLLPPWPWRPRLVAPVGGLAGSPVPVSLLDYKSPSLAGTGDCCWPLHSGQGPSLPANSACSQEREQSVPRLPVIPRRPASRFSWLQFDGWVTTHSSYGLSRTQGWG